MRLNPFRMVGAIKGLIELSKNKRLAKMSGWRTFIFVVVISGGALFPMFLITYSEKSPSLHLGHVFYILIGFAAFIFFAIWVISKTPWGDHLTTNEEIQDLLEEADAELAKEYREAIEKNEKEKQEAKERIAARRGRKQQE